MFAADCLQLKQFPNHGNVRVFPNCVFSDYNELTPLEAIRHHPGLVRAYVGISGSVEGQRIGLHVSQKHYNGDRTAALADGWEWHELLWVTDVDFKDRRYNAAWAERYLQCFLEHGPFQQKIIAEWTEIEPAPIFGENHSNLKDSFGRIVVYLCLKFQKGKTAISNDPKPKSAISDDPKAVILNDDTKAAISNAKPEAKLESKPKRQRSLHSFWSKKE